MDFDTKISIIMEKCRNPFEAIIGLRLVCLSAEISVVIVMKQGTHATILMVRVIVWLVSYMFTLHEWVG